MLMLVVWRKPGQHAGSD